MNFWKDGTEILFLFFPKLKTLNITDKTNIRLKGGHKEVEWVYMDLRNDTEISSLDFFFSYMSQTETGKAKNPAKCSDKKPLEKVLSSCETRRGRSHQTEHFKRTGTLTLLLSKARWGN